MFYMNNAILEVVLKLYSLGRTVYLWSPSLGAECSGKHVDTSLLHVCMHRGSCALCLQVTQAD